MIERQALCGFEAVGAAAGKYVSYAWKEMLPLIPLLSGVLFAMCRRTDSRGKYDG
jgi:hypothetical protein